jgi:hypothetical protein
MAKTHSVTNTRVNAFIKNPPCRDYDPDDLIKTYGVITAAIIGGYAERINKKPE